MQKIKKNKTYISIITFAKIVGEIMTDFLSKSFLEFWIKFEHIDKARNMNSFDITVSQSPNIGTGFDNYIIVGCSTFPVFGYVTTN